MCVCRTCTTPTVSAAGYAAASASASIKWDNSMSGLVAWANNHGRQRPVSSRLFHLKRRLAGLQFFDVAQGIGQRVEKAVGNLERLIPVAFAGFQVEVQS